MEVDSLNRISAPSPAATSAVTPKKPAANKNEAVNDGEQQRTAMSAKNGKSIQNGKPLDKTAISREDNSNEEIAQLDSDITEEFLQKTIERANKELLGAHRQFSYDVHEKTGQFMVKVIDLDTKEVIKELPPEKTLDAVAKMWELAGIFVDERK